MGQSHYSSLHFITRTRDISITRLLAFRKLLGKLRLHGIFIREVKVITDKTGLPVEAAVWRGVTPAGRTNLDTGLAEPGRTEVLLLLFDSFPGDASIVEVI